MTFDLNPEYGSHLPVLETSLDQLGPGSLVLEHGPGLYSSPAIAKRNLRAVVSESLPGWASWTRWLYALHGRHVEIIERHKHLVQHFEEAALLFIDGEARERGPLLQWALEQRVPIIIAHDTEERERDEYGYRSHHFQWKGYTVTDDSGHLHTTTLWRLNA